MRNESVTVSYAIVLGLYWIGYAIISAFASVYLLDVGLSNSAIGIVLSGGAFAAALMQSFVGGFIDRNDRIYNRHVLASLAVLSVILSAIMCMFGKAGPLTVGCIYALCYILLQLSQPFTNALGIEYENLGYKVNFGISRAMGSLGYAACAFLMGVMTVSVGAWIVPVAYSVAFLLFTIAIIFLMPKPEQRKNDSRESISKACSPLDFAKKYPKFVIMLIGLVCIYYTHTLINTYALQILQTKGGDSSDVGIAAALAAGIELIPMLFFPILIKRISLAVQIRISVIFFTVKTFMSLIVPNVASFLAIQILQIGGWGILAIAIVYYVNEVIDIENASQGQALAGTSMTMGTVISTLICGRLLDVLGVNSTLMIGVLVGIIGTIIVFITTKVRE